MVDDANVEPNTSEDDSVVHSRFSPIMNTPSRFVPKCKSKGKYRQPTAQAKLVDAVREIVAIIVRDVQPKAPSPSSSLITLLDSCA